MRWRGPARFRHADLPVARPLTLLNRSPGPETRRNSRFPGLSRVAGVSPGRSPFPATREFLRSPEGQHKRFAPAISRIFLIHTSVHISSAVIPRRGAFSTGPSTVLSTAGRRSRSGQVIVRPPLPVAGPPGPPRLAPNPAVGRHCLAGVGRTPQLPSVTLSQARAAARRRAKGDLRLPPLWGAMCHRPPGRKLPAGLGRAKRGHR
jgi:hypothetical protein